MGTCTVEDVAEYVPNKNSAAMQDGMHEQFVEAKDAVLQIITSGVLGASDKYYFNVHVGGHCEPNHEKRENWSSDFINIQVSQAGVRSEVLAGS